MKKIICILVFLALLIGCSTAVAVLPEKVTGTWVLYKLILNGETYESADLERMGSSQTLEFHADGTGKLTNVDRYGNEEMNYKWVTIKGDKIKMTVTSDDGEVSETAWMENSVIVHGDDEYKAYYKKTSATTSKTVKTAITSAGKFKLNNSNKTASYIAPPSKTAAHVTVPIKVSANGNTYKVTEIGANACSGMTKLTSVSIGNSVTKIGNAAFRGCKALKMVNIPSTVTGIGAKAFNGCKKLVKVTGMGNVKAIGTSAFQDCTALKTITIPGKVKTIGDKAFYGCSALTKVSGMSGVTTIGTAAFQNCKSLTAFTIGAKVTKIGPKAWMGCTKLKTMTIKAKLKASSVGGGAFKIAAKATVKCPSGKKAEFDKWIYKKGLPKTAKTK